MEQVQRRKRSYDMGHNLSDSEESDLEYDQQDGSDSDINSSDENDSSKMQKLDSMFTQKSEFGLPIQQKLADTVNRGVTQNFDFKQGLDFSEKFKTPENCKFLTVPKLNDEMLCEDSIDGKYKSTDAVLQKNQQLLSKGMVPLVLMMDHMFKSNIGDELLFDLATDSLQMLTFAHRDLSNIRRKFLSYSQKISQALCP
jgi:hypothetical protein